MNAPAPDPYEILGVARAASPAEITHAYRTLLRAHHPDTRPHDPHVPADPATQLRRILDAYAILRDPARRTAYDQHHPPPTEPRIRHVTRVSDQPPIQAGPVYWWPT